MSSKSFFRGDDELLVVGVQMLPLHLCREMTRVVVSDATYLTVVANPRTEYFFR